MQPSLHPPPFLALDDAVRAGFRRRLRGPSWTPDDPGYPEARAIWNGAIGTRPALIVRAADTDDVVACVDFARTHGVRLAVRGGGHNAAGSALCADGLVIDLSALRSVEVDVPARRATAGGGATIGDVDRATLAHGLAAPLGVVSDTGIAGLTLGGGFGWLRRRHGLSCDALLAAEVVTADGHVVTASATTHPDLFWALRGGGGNFGVVTRFTYALYEVRPEVPTLFVAYPAAAAPRVLAHLRDAAPDLPDDFAPIAVLGHVPPAPAFPEAAHGLPMVLLAGPWLGDPAEGARVLAPFRRLAEPIADLSGPMPFLDVQTLFDEDYPSGDRYYWTSAYLDGLPDDAIARLVALNAEAPSKRATLDVWVHGGALARVPAAATGFGDRRAPFLLGIEANWSEPALDAACMAWGRRVRAALQPYATGGTYLNFPGSAEEGGRSVAATYGEGLERLRAVKRRYDPAGLFTTHQPIALTTA